MSRQSQTRRLSRVLALLSVVAAAVSVAPSMSLASSVDEFVIVERDGDVTVRTLTPAQAERVAAQPDVRIVAPDQPMELFEQSSDPYAIPTDAADGEIIPGRYIVEFDGDASTSVAAASLGDRVRARFTDALDGFVADLTDAQVEALREDPSLVHIEHDRVVSISATQNNATWGLDRIDQRALPLDATYTYTRTGAGVAAYILDTGIQSDHPEFANRLLPGFTSINDGRGTNDCQGHGTHVAGTVAGTTWGVAKRAELVPVRVLDCGGSGSWSGIIGGLDWIVRTHSKGAPAVANMSLGGMYSLSVNSAVARVIAHGVTVVVAAGNSNANACNYSPASAPDALTVGATASNDARASFSNHGPCLDLFAPGSLITSAWIGGTVRTISGTSMAAPHVAGAAALYLEDFPRASPSAVSMAVVGAATMARVSSPGTGSPNRLLYAASFEPAPPSSPNMPTNLRATSGTRQVSLSWSAPVVTGGSPVSDYVVEWSSDSGATWNVFDDGVNTKTTAVVTGLTLNGPHWFRVRAVNIAGASEPSAIVTSTPFVPTVASAPRSLTATAGLEVVSLSWTAPLTNGGASITDYVVEQSTDLGETWTQVVKPVSTSRTLTVKPVTGGITHTFRVSAVNNEGRGAVSATASATPWTYTAPGAPRNVAATARVQSLYVTWTAPATNGGSVVTGYSVDWSNDGGTTWKGEVQLSNGYRWVTLTGLTGGVAHEVRVRALNAYGTSGSTSVTATPLMPNPPSEPRSVTVRTSYENATVSWTRPASSGTTAVVGYHVEWSDDDGQSWTRESMIASTRQVLSGLRGGVPHRFRVVAVNSIGVGAPSAAVTATPLAFVAPSSPVNASGFSSGTTAYLSWSRPVNTGGSPVTDYQVWKWSGDSLEWEIVGIVVAPSRSMRIDGLTGNTEHRFRVVARNAYGASAPSQTVAVVTRVFGTPNPPSVVSATVDLTRVVVVWSPVTSSYGAVTDYVVEYALNNSTQWRVYPDGVSTATRATLGGFAPNISVSVRVRAVNRYGTGPASGVVTVTPTATPVVPDAPTAVTAAAGDSQVRVRWFAPVNDGGAAVSSYIVEATPGGQTCETTSTSCVVSQLTNGVSYAFTVRAVNAAGTGPASEASDPVTPVVSTSPPVTARSWGLDRTDQRSLPLDGMIARVGSGATVDVYVVDTGVFAGHKDLAGRVADGFSSINDGRGTDDCHGHGTHVAGTVAGTEYGLANAARVIPVRVLNCVGSGSTATVVAGINWAIQHHLAGTPAVMNLSLGGGFDSVLNDAVARAVDDGITVVVAAGNSNADACGVSPASAPAALTVGASTIFDSRASYSNVGRCLDIFAPGSAIVSLDITSATSLRTLSGTSMAAPHVAGVAAQLLGSTPSLTPAEVTMTILQNSTQGIVTDVGVGSPNRLLFARATQSSFDSDNVVDGRASNALEEFDRSASDSDAIFVFDYGSDLMPDNIGTGPVESPDLDTPPVPTPVVAPVPGVTPLPVTQPSPMPTPVTRVDPGMVPTRDPGVLPVTGPEHSPQGSNVVRSDVAQTRTVAATSALKVAVRRIDRRGSSLRVTVDAPKGATVTLYRNGKKVASGKNRVFTVKIARVTHHSFVAVATDGAVRVSSVRAVIRTSGSKLR